MWNMLGFGTSRPHFPKDQTSWTYFSFYPLGSQTQGSLKRFGGLKLGRTYGQSWEEQFSRLVCKILSFCFPFFGVFSDAVQKCYEIVVAVICWLVFLHIFGAWKLSLLLVQGWLHNWFKSLFSKSGWSWTSYKPSSFLLNVVCFFSYFFLMCPFPYVMFFWVVGVDRIA